MATRIRPLWVLFNDGWLDDQREEEDVLQLVHVNAKDLLINVGRYEEGVYKIHVVADQNWESPKAEFESTDLEVVNQKVYEFVKLYARGKV